MDEQSQNRRYSQNSINNSHGTRYASLGSSTSHPDLLADLPTDRYRNGQHHLGLSVSARSLGSSVGADSQFYPDQISAFSGPTSLPAATQVSYESDYDTSDGGAGVRQQQQQTAGFGSYNASMMMYSVPQANTQPSIYNTSQYATSLSSRNNPLTSAPLLSDQTDANQSYFGTPVAGVSATTSLEHASTAASYYQDIPPSFHYAEGAAGGGSAGSASGTSGLGRVESFYHLADLAADGATAMPESSAPNKAADFEEKWQDYQRRLANVFKEITDGNLERAAEGLLSVSFWLLSRVEELGKSPSSAYNSTCCIFVLKMCSLLLF